MDYPCIYWRNICFPLPQEGTKKAPHNRELFAEPFCKVTIPGTGGAVTIRRRLPCALTAAARRSSLREGAMGWGLSTLACALGKCLPQSQQRFCPQCPFRGIGGVFYLVFLVFSAAAKRACRSLGSCSCWTCSNRAFRVFPSWGPGV